MTSGLTRIGAAILGLIAFATPLFPASAKPLLSEACVKLLGEHVDLGKGGIENSMDHDPANAAEILKPEELAKIERYLFIEGQIRFRCPEIRLPVTKEPKLTISKEAKMEAAKPEPPEKPSGPPPPLPKRKPAPPKKKAG